MAESSLPVRHLLKIVLETEVPSVIPGAPQDRASNTHWE